MKTYYAMWKSIELRFGEPRPYDFTFSMRFPNIVLEARNLEEAKKKIEAINTKAKGLDRFDFEKKGIMRKTELYSWNHRVTWTKLRHSRIFNLKRIETSSVARYIDFLGLNFHEPLLKKTKIEY